MGENLPAMKLWVSDFYGSARVAMLTWWERGLYLDMLIREWQYKGDGLPGGEELVELLKGPGCSAADAKTLRRAIAKISQTFFIEIDGRLFNERLEDELRSVLSEKKALSEAGKKAAAARWRNNAIALHPSPSPSPSSPLTPAERGGRSLRSEGRSPRCLGTNPRAGDGGDPERSALIHRVKQLAGRRLNGYEVVSTGLVHLVSGAEERWGTISIDRLRKIDELARGEEGSHGR